MLKVWAEVENLGNTLNMYVITDYIKNECVYTGVILWGNEDYVVMTLVWETIDFNLNFLIW